MAKYARGPYGTWVTVDPKGMPTTTPAPQHPRPAPQPVTDATNLIRRAPGGGTAYVAPPADTRVPCPVQDCVWSIRREEPSELTSETIVGHLLADHTKSGLAFTLGYGASELREIAEELYQEQQTSAALSARLQELE